MFFWSKFHEKAEFGIKNEPKSFPAEKTTKSPRITSFSKNIDRPTPIIDFFLKKFPAHVLRNR